MATNRILVQRTHGHALQVYVTGTRAHPAILLLHGGPGGGARLQAANYADLACARIIHFDQRGTGNSRYADPLAGNNTSEQIGDIEAIRRRLGIDQWIVAGGSWGALLGVLYAEQHPDRVCALVVRSIFLDRTIDTDWLMRDGGPAPRSRDRLLSFADSTEPLKSLAHESRWAPEATQYQLAAAWNHFERVLSGLDSDDSEPTVPTARLLLDIQIELHYIAHGFFVTHDQAAQRSSELDGIPGLVLQGDNDGVIAPDSAEHLSQRWPDAHVRRIRGAGHSLSDPSMNAAWQQALSDTFELCRIRSLR